MLETLHSLPKYFIAETRSKRVSPSDSYYQFFSKQLPQYFKENLILSNSIKIRGLVGQPNHTYARVPLIAFFDTRITTSAKHGYYLTLIFSEDMSKAYLSLNQGFDEATEKMKLSDKLNVIRARSEKAQQFIIEMGLNAHNYLSSIDLSATLPRGKGYEAGHIIGTEFRLDSINDDDKILSEASKLLSIYDVLVETIGSNLWSNEITLDEEAFQLITNTANYSLLLPDGPIPKKGTASSSTNKQKFDRSPAVASQALRNADYRCEFDNEHISFISKHTNENFVEAHHLIPLSAQKMFEFSLDVPENIVSLCPNCHRAIHHANENIQLKMIEKLHKSRKKELKKRGIYATKSDIVMTLL